MRNKPSQDQPRDTLGPPETPGQGSTLGPKSIWDNALPAGDSPPLPRWPLTASIVAYCIWMVFLVSMMVLRIKETAG